jgi:hypothetical protein
MDAAVASLNVEVCANSTGDDVLLLVEPALVQSNNNDEVSPNKQSNGVAIATINTDSKPSYQRKTLILSEQLLAADCGLGLLRTGFNQYDDNEEGKNYFAMAAVNNQQNDRGKDVVENVSIIDGAEIDTVNEEQIMKYSNLFPGNKGNGINKTNRRTVWVVTTAALPWRTGTSVNPLWRAVYLAEDGHKVTLLIPWLDDVAARKKLYGSQNFFPGGSNEQREWLFTNYFNKYQEEKNLQSENFTLQIQFWKGTYQESFGSIFPIEDICSLIPSDEADVAILEEPEHLNWFRVIHNSSHNKRKKKATNKAATATTITDNECPPTIAADPPTRTQTRSAEDDDANDEVSLLYGCPTIPTTKTVTAAIEATTRKLKISSGMMDEIKASDTEESESTEGACVVVGDEEYDVNVIGWGCKFRYVIGILHTNYGDYIRQYGVFGTSMIGASALHALSSLVVRAYCHKVIKLSDTLPSYWTIKHNPTYKYPAGTSLEGLAEFMEITCNVHGVRTDFLDPPVISKEKNMSDTAAAPVYFIGKLIWAKGFEQALELQELFKSKTGDYFPMDVYGTGNDEKAIQRAFFGRHNPISRGESNMSTETSDSGGGTSSDVTKLTDQDTIAIASSNTEDDGDEYVVDVKTNVVEQVPVTTIFDSTASLRSEVDDLLTPKPLSETNTTTALSTASSGSVPSTAHDEALSPTNNESGADSIEQLQNNDAVIDPLAILGDVTQKTVGTGVETAEATVKMVESLINKGLGLFSFGGEKVKGNAGDAISGRAEGNIDQTNQRAKAITGSTAPVDQHSISIPFHLAPARARFKWRRHPIPARFLGVQDHIVVRDIPLTKVFLNMSTSEVLCTTSAEALAMGKFVILPKHRKFVQQK